ncbi:aldehyde dehydrogenase [Lichtheimia corymbifera JMRC:FSU:9682]|uniref:Aldehyde dehydrogenase n=1 Tax=Lichtheimia corymbifera JMRC:FSU:9682 TaxID=1263082 RepID=A0A068RQ86_9FUNG|nr:aldehyde dehydrogenase [Lichtheimia corymbifera JMRC:FSU:9682]
MSFVVEYTTPKGHKLTLNTGLFINNEFVAGANTIDTINPSTGKVITAVQAAEKEQVDLAVDAAEKAFQSWRHVSGRERARLMNKLADLVERDAEQLAVVEALDNGKPVAHALMLDVSCLMTALRYNAGWCDKIHGKVIETEGKLSYTRHEPIGVCAGVIPWNFPLATLATKLAPALATANTVVIKTSEMTPLSALKFADLVKEAGFPPGVINIITGYGPITGDALARHPKVGKITFTGSTVVGRHIMKTAAESNLKKVTLELGGKSPNIIFDDVEDLDKAVSWAWRGIYMNAGQICTAGSRIFVQEKIYDKFLEKFTHLASSHKVGDAFEEGSFQGPQISQRQFDRVMEYIDIGKKEGATLHKGGKRIGDVGYFIEPTIFTDCKPEHRILREEIFGPVVAICKFKHEDEVIKLANDTTYGLAAAVFTSSISTAVNVSNQLEAGSVWVNCYNMIDVMSPFGGYKQSGIGRENGEYGLENYLQVKSVKINIDKPSL